MTGRITNGTLIALVAYSLMSFGDALVKSLGRELHVFQIGFFTTATALLVVGLAKPPQTTWREAVRMTRPLAIFARAIAGLGASFLGIIAFTRLPLSEAYALMFLAPLVAAVMAAILLKERVGPAGWFAIMLGLVGVMLVVRPGFDAVMPAHGAAFGVALSMAAGMILMRTIAANESRTAILLVLMTMICFCYAVACLLFGKLSMPSVPQFAKLAAIGILGTAGQVLLLRAAAIAPASRVAPAQYFQLVWASLIGAIFFTEYPDATTISGLILIAAAGLLILRWRPVQPLGVEQTDR